MPNRPYLRLGRGRVLQEEQPGKVCIGAPAVQAGIPLDRDPALLAVSCFDGLGGAAPFA